MLSSLIPALSSVSASASPSRSTKSSPYHATPRAQAGFPLLHRYYDSWEALLRKAQPKLATHITRELGGFMGLDGGSYERMCKEDDAARFVIPGFYTTAWFQAMLVGGDRPAPSTFAPRLMDNLLLDGNISIIFAVGLAIMKQEKSELLKQTGDALAERLKSMLTRCKDVKSIFSAAIELNIKEKFIYPSE